MNQSSYLDSLAFEYFKSAIVVVSLLLVVCDISVIYIIIDGLGASIGVGFLRFLVPICPFEVVSQGWVAIVLNGLELSIRIEAKDSAEDVVKEAEDRISECELAHARVICQIGLILNGGEEVYHEIYGKEDADEDVDHGHLITELVLHDVQKEEEENAEDCLAKEGRCSYEV